jgi:ATP-dependent helicase Lhr and Lhr-like helicase
MKPNFEPWFQQHGWRSFPFQRAVWRHHAAGRQGLIHAATGTGKTYAAWFAALQAKPGPKLSTLWITPLRALAADTLTSLRQPVDDLKLGWKIEARTGDTPSSLRQRQRLRMPNALVTTPESLSLLLSYEDARDTFSHLTTVIVDEWHEQLGTKRGVQTELALARLRHWCPTLQTWGLSATIGNLQQALEVLLGSHSSQGVIVEGRQPKKILIDALLPDEMDRFPWAGHLGAQLLPQVVGELQKSRSSLVFTNTRSQAEAWYQMLLEACPDWAGEIALHHGSLSRESRDWVEEQLRLGTLRCVVCTSSLDLGVDFTTVDRILQIGSPKGVARLLQRAGRSGHQPGSVSRATCVPGHAFELVELSAARQAIKAGFLESRSPLDKPIDLLTQHLVTVACGGGFEATQLLNEIRSTHAYRHLTDNEWRWALNFVSKGGDALHAYPDYQKLSPSDEGLWRPTTPSVIHRHRMSIGTITGSTSMRVQYLKGPSLGHVEEYFIASLKPGSAFIFAGKLLELVSTRDMTAWVKPATASKGAVPRWMGSRMPISSLLSAAVRDKLQEAHDGHYRGVEMRAVKPVLETQRRMSAIPQANELLIETLILRDGHHVFLYPFDGLLVHEGLAPLLAYRLSRIQPQSIKTSSNDYGIELVSREPIPIEQAIHLGLFSPDNLEEDIYSSINAAELARRQFREVARVAGLTFQGYPGQPKAARHLQASSGLLYDVLSRFDPTNLLLAQAHREVLETNLESSRLRTTLERISAGRILNISLDRGSPLSFPVLVDNLRGSAVSSEQLLDRIRKMQQRLERAAS